MFYSSILKLFVPVDDLHIAEAFLKSLQLWQGHNCSLGQLTKRYPLKGNLKRRKTKLRRSYSLSDLESINKQTIEEGRINRSRSVTHLDNLPHDDQFTIEWKTQKKLKETQRITKLFEENIQKTNNDATAVDNRVKELGLLFMSHKFYES